MWSPNWIFMWYQTSSFSQGRYCFTKSLFIFGDIKQLQSVGLPLRNRARLGNAIKMMLLVAIFKSTAKLKEKQILHSPLMKGTARAGHVLFLPRLCQQAWILRGRSWECWEYCCSSLFPSKLWQAFCIVINHYKSVSFLISLTSNNLRAYCAQGYYVIYVNSGCLSLQPSFSGPVLHGLPQPLFLCLLSVSE